MPSERDRTGEYVLRAAHECGVLAAYTLAIELRGIEVDGFFTSADACARAAKSERLREAILRACGEVSPRKVGWFLTTWAGCPLGPLSVKYVGDDPSGKLWKIVSEVETQVASPSPSIDA